jgi:hypothetical protein
LLFEIKREGYHFAGGLTNGSAVGHEIPVFLAVGMPRVETVDETEHELELGSQFEVR